MTTNMNYSKSALIVILYIIGVVGAIDVVDDNNKPRKSLRQRFRRLFNRSVNNNKDIATQRKLETGCYAKHQEGTSYPIGGIVSATITDTTSISAPTYTLGDDGQWIIVNDDSEPKSTTSNYECNSIWCGDQMYGPGEAGESLAWNKLGECDPTLAPPEQPLPPIWSEEGCPVTFNPQENDYEGGEVREIDGIVYKCAGSPQNMFCGMDGMFVLFIIIVYFVCVHNIMLVYVPHTFFPTNNFSTI